MHPAIIPRTDQLSEPQGFLKPLKKWIEFRGLSSGITECRIPCLRANNPESTPPPCGSGGVDKKSPLVEGASITVYLPVYHGVSVPVAAADPALVRRSQAATVPASSLASKVASVLSGFWTFG